MTAKYSPTDCARILALQEKATPGPWNVVYGKRGRTQNCTVYGPGLHVITMKDEDEIKSTDKHICTVWNVTCTCIQGKQYNNQEFIAAAHSMADQLRAAMEVIERQAGTLARIGSCIDNHCSECKRDAREALTLTETTDDN